MKEKLLILFLFSLLSITLGAQSLDRSVIASDGASSSLGDVTLDWTLGELATTTVVTESGLLTQGFHQPLLSVTRLLTYESLEEYYAIRIMPNPVSSFLTIDVKADLKEPLAIELLDLNGKVLDQGKIEFPFQPFQFDMTQYPSGLYVVRVKTQENKPISFFKVNKLD
jgi:hypothetical protein